MRIAKLVYCMLPAITAIACGDPSSSGPAGPAARIPSGPQLITGGRPTGSDFGGVGAVLVDANADFIPETLCTGSLVSPTVFLTAGHCIGGPGTVYFVAFDPDIIPFSLITLLIPSVTASASPDDDLGVVVLPPGATTGIPVYDLPSAGFLTEANALGGLARDRGVLVGYGVSSLGGMESSGLDGTRRVAETKILSLLGRQIVVRGANGNSSLGGFCFGDSGGPLFLESNTSVIVGVASGVRHLGCQALAAHVRVDTPTARAFLSQFLTL
jgi:hypothetical protein